MASRNGLNPKIRGQKGVGFGRALPAPFGFDLSFKGSGSSYFNIPTLIGTQMPNAITIEFWMKPTSSTRDTFLSIFGFKSTANLITSLFTLNNKIALSPEGVANLSCEAITSGAWNHFVFTCDFVNGFMRCVTNGNISVAPAGFTIITAPIVSAIGLCGGVGGAPYNEPIDEFRIYNKVISDSEIVTNYNTGIGNSPSITENLLLWYKFEQFENLDFSPLQDNSDLRLGIRDFSGKNNHIVPTPGMDTNALSSTYVLHVA